VEASLAVISLAPFKLVFEAFRVCVMIVFSCLVAWQAILHGYWLNIGRIMRRSNYLAGNRSAGATRSDTTGIQLQD
jgi:hypothetical protein